MRFLKISALILLTSLLSTAQEAPEELPPACTSSFYDGSLIRNFGVFGPSAFDDNSEWYETHYSQPSSKAEAIERLSHALGIQGRDQNFESCQEKALNYLSNHKVNLYIYFHGFGQHVQENDRIDVPNIFKWINQRDPNAIILSIAWNCDSAVQAGHDLCLKLGKSFDYSENPSAPHPVMKNFLQATELFARVQKEQGNFEVLKEQAFGFIGKYNETLSHSIEVAMKLVDHALVAEMGDIHFVGYSMGAQSAAEILVTDTLLESNSEQQGYQWSSPEACEEGGNTCLVSKLKKVKWSLSLGLPGWTYALRETYNRFDPISGLPPKELEARRQTYSNGGLLRIKSLEGDLKNYNNKLNVFNKRKDPTSDADDAIERGLQGNYAEYNHYGHDYDRALFKNSSFVNGLESFISAENPKDNLEFGIAWDVANYFDFDTCQEESLCTPTNYYTAHISPMSHSGLAELTSREPILTSQGVPHPDKDFNRAVDFSNERSTILTTWSTDQEDTRGGVEFFYQPKTELENAPLKGLFSYGTCESSEQELMPEAFIENDALIFQMKYRENNEDSNLSNYRVSLNNLSANPAFQKDEWVHLAFNWELPTPSELISIVGKAPQQIGALLQSPRHALAAQEYQLGFVLYAGASKAPSSSFRSQIGQGQMSIWVNGEMAASAALGTENSQRHCLSSREVLSDENIEDATPSFFPPYRPWTNYDVGSDQVAQIGGKLCKGYKIRNTTVHFGCAQNNQVSAAGLMDDIRLVFGKPRSSYPEVSSDGSPIPW